MLQWTWVYKYLFDTLPSAILSIYPEVELLGHMVIIFLIFWGIAILFSTVAVPFYLLTNSAQSFHFLHILANTCILLSVGFFFFSFECPLFLAGEEPRCMACGILVPWLGIEPRPLKWKPGILTIRPPGNSLLVCLFVCLFLIVAS